MMNVKDLEVEIMKHWLYRQEHSPVVVVVPKITKIIKRLKFIGIILVQQ